jgi:mono/diheme cytochrome c family protein
MIGASAEPSEQVPQLFIANCAPCHGDQGQGGLGPSLHANPFVQTQTDDGLKAFLLAGRDDTAMPGFQGRLSEEQLASIIALLGAWQK